MNKYKLILAGILFFVIGGSATFGQSCSDATPVQAVFNGDFEKGYLTSASSQYSDGAARGFKSDLLPVTDFTGANCVYGFGGKYGIAKNLGATGACGADFPYIGAGYPGAMVFEDHTPTEGGDGFALLVDFIAAANSSSVYTGGLPVAWLQEVTIFPSETYYFSAWFGNYTTTPGTPELYFVVTPIDAANNLVIAERTVVGTAQPTGVMQWQQFSGEWNPTGVYTKAQISIEVDFTLTAPASGADFAFDDISFKNGCDDLLAGGDFDPDLGTDFSLCNTGGTSTLDFGGASNAFQQIRWYEVTGTGTDNLIAAANDTKTLPVSISGTNSTGKYRVCIQEAGKCARNSIVEVKDDLAALSIADIELCTNPTETVDCTVDFVSPINSITWKKDGTTEATDVRTLTISSPGNYSVDIVGDGNCDASETFTVTSLIPIADEDPFSLCAGKTMDLTVTDPTAGGNIDWYTTATGGVPVLTSATLLSYSAGTLPFTYYVENAAQDNYTAGYATTGPTFSNSDPQRRVDFVSDIPLVINSVQIKPTVSSGICWSPGGTQNYTIGLYLGTGAGATATGQTVTQAINCTGGIQTVALGFNVPAGNYQLRLEKGAGLGAGTDQHYIPTATIVSLPGVITINKSNDPLYGGPFFNWDIGVPKGCARIPVNVIEKLTGCCPVFDGVAINEASVTTCSVGGTETFTANKVGANLAVNLYEFRWLNGATEVKTWTAGSAGLSLTNAELIAGGAGTYTVELRIIGNVTCTAVSSGVTLTVNTTPTTPVLAGTQAYCAGDNISLNVTAGTVTTGATYAWEKDVAAIAGTTATYTKASSVTTDAGSYTVTATKDGCSSAESASYALTVNEVPAKPTITANPTATSICTGDAVTLTSASVTTGVTYVWTKGTASGTNDKDIVIASAVTGDGGTYTTTATKTENGKACISPASDNFVLTVNTTPVTPILAGTQAYCAGESLSINVTPGTATTGATYAWKKDAAAIAGTTATYTKASSVTTDAGSYTVTATNAGCSSAESAGYAVTVDEAVTIAAITPAAVCFPGTVDITTGAVTPGTATVTYHVGAGGTGAIQPTATAVTGTAVYSVKAVNGQCNTTSDVNVTVTPLPLAPTVAPLSYCKDATGAAVLTATGAGLTWYTAATSGTATAPTPSTAIVTTFDYYVSQTVTSCEGPRANLQVTINALPTVSATSDDADNKICLGDNVTLTGGGADTYVWDNSVTDRTAFTPTGTVNYTVTGTNTATTCTNTASVQVEVNALPTVTATVTGSPACLGANVTLTGGGASTYTWDNGVANATAFATTAVGTTTYEVEGTDANGCKKKATVDVVVNALPTAVLTGTASICNKAGVTTDLNIALTGAQPWEVVYNNPITGNQTINPTSSPATVAVNNAGDYTLVSVKDANNCTATSATGTATIDYLDEVIATYETKCSGDEVGTLVLGGTDFQIVLTVTQGDLSSITATETTVHGVTFTREGTTNQWVSGAIDESNTVVADIKDVNDCNTLTRSGMNTRCSCPATGTTVIGTGGLLTETICNDAGVESTVTVTYNGGSSDYRITLDQPTSADVIKDNETGTTTFAVSEAGTYNVEIYSNGNACPVNGGSVTLAHHTTPVAQLTATSATTVCAGDNVTLEVKLTAGDAPFTFNLDNTTPVSSVAKTGATTTFTEAISTTGDYSITNVKDNNGCIGTASGAVTIANHANTAATAITKCDTPLGGVTLAADEFQIVVTATAGTFTSDPITETTAHGVTFSRVGLTDVWYSGAINEANAVDLDFADDNGCNTVDLDGLQKRCSCPAEIDDFTIDKTEICASPSQTATLTVTYSGGDATDTYTLSLTGAETQSNAGAAGSTSTTFTVSTPGTYNVAITNITQGNCVINGTTQKVLAHYTTPKAEITGDASICDDAPTVTTPLTITLTDGVAPFTLDVSNGVGAITGATTAHTENVSASGSYTLSNLVDNNGCEGTVSGSATITHLAKVAATPTTRCDDESPLGSISLTDSEYQIVVTATAGDMASLVITGATFQETAAGSGIWYSGAIAETVTSAVHVTDANDCEGGIDLTGITRTCSCQAKGVTTLTTGTICAEGNTTIEVVTSGLTGNYNVTLTQPDATTQVASSKPTGTEVFTVSQAGDYTVVVQDATDGCVANGGTVRLAHYPVPTATIAGDASICAAGTVSTSTGLAVTLTAGTAPFAIDLLGGTATENLTNLTSPHTQGVSTAGVYTLTNLVDANGCQGTIAPTEKATITNFEKVIASGSAVCNSTPLLVLGGVTLSPTQYQVVVEVTQGDLASTVVTKLVGGVSLTRLPLTNKWYSGAIDETTATDVHVTDGNNCEGGIDITGLQNQCSCPIAATATLLPGSICDDGTSTATLTVNVTSSNTTDMTDYTIAVTGAETVGSTETPDASGAVVNKTYNVNTNGAYAINVTSNGQNGACVVSAGGQNLTVNALPTASITTTGTALEYCQGETPITLTATQVIGATSYEWFKGGVTQGTTLTNSKTNATADAAWTVKVTDANGCDQTSNPVAVIENALPIASITTTGTALAYCKDGAGVVLRATNVPNATTYEWFKETTSVTIGAGDTKTGALAGSWTVKVIDDNTCTATSTAVSVIENPLPTPSITTSGTDLAYCKNATGVTLAATGGVDYAWIKDNGTPTAYSTTATTSDAKFGNWQVKVKDAKGCEATSLAVTVTENTLPTATLTSATNPVIYCAGTSAPIITVAITGNGPFTYDYTGGANGTGQSTGTITTSNTDNAATTYQLTKVTDANNCEGTSFGASVVVTQEEVPGVPTLRSDAETTVCEATVFNITATSVAVGTPTIIWEQGGTGTEASPSIVVGNTAGSVTIYQAKAKIGNCPSESSLPLVVTVKESATVSLTVNKTTVCEEEKVVFTASSTHADPGVTYDWYLNIEVAGINTEIKTVTTINPTYEVKLTDSDVLYSVKIANNSSCVGAEVSSNLQAVAVTKLPKPTLNSLSESLCGTDGGFDLVARDENGVIYTSGIDWRDGNDDKLLETSGSYHVTKTGTYAVYVTKNGCRSKIHSGRTVAQVVVQELSLDFSPSETQDIEEDEEVVLEAIVGGGIGVLEYAWTRTETGNVTGSSSSYVYPASKTENVSVVVTDTQTNCTVSSGVTEINVLKSFKVPNAFTPNGDGFNDTWNIEGLETYRNSVMNVYNRWGQLVYSNHGSYTEAWDGRRNGKDLPIGTYYYVITLNQDGKENVSGDVTIVR